MSETVGNLLGTKRCLRKKKIDHFLCLKLQKVSASLRLKLESIILSTHYLTTWYTREFCIF